MKCFIHKNKEAIAACKTCGKGMCEDCSAYSNHKGICPECRIEEFQEEIQEKQEKLSDLRWSIAKNIICMVLLFWLFLIPVLIGGIFLYNNIRKYQKTKDRIETLNNEIKRLNDVLTSTGGKSFK